MSEGNGQGKGAGPQHPSDAAPPRLDRVPPGYRPPPSRAATPPPRPAAAPAEKARPGSSYGLAEREVTAAAAIAAGLPREGSLAGDGALRLFLLAAACQAHGRLTLASGPARYALTFRRGTVEHAASGAVEDELGRFLVRRTALSPEQLVRAEGARASAGGELVTALLSERLVAPADVARLLGDHGAALVGRALALEAGTWSWEPGAAPPPTAFPLGNPYAMACAAVRALDAGGAARRLGDRANRGASRVGGRMRVEDLRLAPQEARVTSLFDGRSPAEIAVAQPADAATVLRVALLLAEAELLAFGEVRAAPRAAESSPRPSEAAHLERSDVGSAAERSRGTTSTTASTATGSPEANHPERSRRTTSTSTATEGPAPIASAARPAVSRPPPPPAPAPAPTAIDPAEIRALLERLEGVDHFEVLGVKRDASPAQVKVAYFRLAKTYHPDAVPAGASAEVRALCADVFTKVSAAWSVLGDEAQRAKYVDELATGGAADVDVMRILQAENVFQAGTALVRGRRYTDALAKFRDAVVLNPDEPEFGIWLAWCEFLVARDPRAQHAPSAAAIEDGLRRNARCAPGYLFLGQMAKLTGDLALAERHLRRGLAVAPEHVDLVRELRYLRK